MTKKAVRSITIQPIGKGLQLPYPYHIDSIGMVGRQEFWKGEPLKLVGFSDVPINGEIHLMFTDFWSDPEKAVGRFPVFMHKNGDWFTYTSPITNIRKNSTT
jgi:hypothetical protein